MVSRDLLKGAILVVAVFVAGLTVALGCGGGGDGGGGGGGGTTTEQTTTEDGY
jgi:hypothetical protein